MEYIGTFGQNHFHPKTGQSLKNSFVIIEAKNENEAHKKMVNRFGQKWAFLYTDREEAGVDRFGLEEIQ